MSKTSDLSDVRMSLYALNEMNLSNDSPTPKGQWFILNTGREIIKKLGVFNFN